MRSYRVFVFLVLFVVVLQGAILDEVAIDRLANTRISGNVWPCCVVASFGQPIETFNGRQYSVFYDNLGNVCVGRRTVFDASWDTLRIAGYITSTTDGHNTPVLGVSPLDGTLHLAWDHHNNYLHYAVSAKGLLNTPDSFSWSGTVFGPVRSSEVMPGLNVVTYPHFLRRPDGVLQFITRLNGGSGAADWALWEYNADSSKWNSVGLFLSKTGSFTWPDDAVTNSRCAYPNGYTYHDNRLHLTWCWREDISHPGNTNHDLMYAYSDNFGRTWRNSAGDSIGAAVVNPMKLATPGIKVWDIPVNRGYINQVCQNVDSRGRVHAITWHVRDGSADVPTYFPPNGWYFHYWRDTTGIWRRDSLFALQERCKLVFDCNDNAFLMTASAVVYGATASSGWTDWTQVVNESIGGGEPTVDFSLWNTSQGLSMMSANLSMLDVVVSNRSWPSARLEVRNGSDQSALSDARILIYRNDTLYRGGLTDSAGYLSLRLEPGSYKMVISRFGFGSDTLLQAVNGSDTAVLPVIVLQPLNAIGLRILPESVTLNLNDSAMLSVRTIYPDSSEADCSETITWISRNPALAEVDSAGTVRSFGISGTAVIVCIGDRSGLQDSTEVTVNLSQEIVLFPLEDAYVRAGVYANQNFGSETGLMTKTSTLDYTRWSYLKFGLDSLGSSMVVLDAKLKLFVTTTDITNSMPMTAYGVDDVSWTESTLTWNNRPLPAVSLDTAIILPTNYLDYEWDVTSWVVSHRTSGLMSLCLLDTTHKENNVVYASKENTDNKPVLVVTVSPVVSGERGVVTGELSLNIHPNPFNPRVSIRLQGFREKGTVSIYALSGRRVACLNLERGSAEWNAVNQPSGLYFIRVRAGTRFFHTHAVLLK